jgi:translocator assembly and maintenance protein 41
VIDVNSICADLLDWKTLYCAGRLHKPIATLKSSARVQAANQANLASALRTALLLLPESFSEAELYETIAGLSYRGDPRMGVAENPAKVRNIVSAQMEHFQRLYAPFVAEAGVYRSGKAWEQDGSVEAMSGRVENLPVGLKDRIRADYERTARFEAKDGSDEKGAVWRSVVQRPDFASMVSNGLKQIVGGSALSQSLKGVLTVGPWKGLQYLWPKIQKRFA